MTGPQSPGPRAATMLAHAVMAATHFLEVRAGHRPVSHLDALIAPSAQRRVRSMVRRRRDAGGASTVTLRRVFAERRPGAIHVVVLLVQDGRMRPVAMGIEVTSQGPLITSIGLPEDHQPRAGADRRAGESVIDHAGRGHPHPEALAAIAPAPTLLRGGQPDR